MTAATTLVRTGRNGVTLAPGALAGLLGGALLMGTLIGAVIQLEIGMSGAVAQARPLTTTEATIQRARLAAGNGPVEVDGAASTRVLSAPPPWVSGPPSDGFGFPRPVVSVPLPAASAPPSDGFGFPRPPVWTIDRTMRHAPDRGPVER